VTTGATTLRELAQSLPALMVCEDEWLIGAEGADREPPVVSGSLGEGATAPCDDDEAHVDHLLHYIQVDEETCKARVLRRNIERAPLGSA